MIRMCSMHISDGVVSAVYVRCVYRMCVECGVCPSVSIYTITVMHAVCLACVWTKCCNVFGMCVCVIVHVPKLYTYIVETQVGTLYFLPFCLICD